MSCVIHHTEINCALGNSPTVCTDNLLQGHKPIVHHSVDGLNIPVNLPYFPMSGLPIQNRTNDFLLQILTEQMEGLLATIPLSNNERKKTGLFLGSSSLEIEQSEQIYKDALLKNPANAFAMPKIGYNNIGLELRRAYQLSHHQFTITTACTSSVNALLTAKRFLDTGRLDHAIVLGYELFNETTFLGFNSLGLISPTAEFKPFDQHRNGLILGEGCALIFLSREQHNHKIKLSGGAVTTDSHSLTAANADGSTINKVIQQALESTQTETEEVQGIKAHGTASVLNDEAEAASITTLFQQPPPIFAFKPYVGHTLGACGAIETALFTECLKRGVLPTNKGIAQNNSELGVKLNQEQLPASCGKYLLNYYAFGGNNTALVLEK